MRGLEHYNMTLKSHHKFHMPCHHFLCYSVVINELWFFLYLDNFQSFSKSFRKFSYFYIMMSNCKNDFMGALEHHHMTLQPHHTCHNIIHVISLLNSFDINDNHTQHHGSTRTSSYDFTTSLHMSHHRTFHFISFFINELLWHQWKPYSTSWEH